MKIVIHLCGVFRFETGSKSIKSNQITIIMTELIKHPEFGAIRTQIIGGEPWFCVKDVCKALGYIRHHDALRQHCREEGVR